MPGRATVFRWLARHKQFRDRYILARDFQAEGLGEEMFEIIRDTSGDNLARARLRIRASATVRGKPLCRGDLPKGRQPSQPAHQYRRGRGRGPQPERSRESLLQHNIDAGTGRKYRCEPTWRRIEGESDLGRRSPSHSPAPTRQRRGRRHYDNRRAAGAALRDGNRSRASGVPR
jgi:hypothetical protein